MAVYIEGEEKEQGKGEGRRGGKRSKEERREEEWEGGRRSGKERKEERGPNIAQVHMNPHVVNSSKHPCSKDNILMRHDKTCPLSCVLFSVVALTEVSDMGLGNVNIHMHVCVYTCSYRPEYEWSMEIPVA